MCDGCCGGVCGWCRAFTKTERFLVILEIFLLLIFIVCLVFLILHLVACADRDGSGIGRNVTATFTTETTTPQLSTYDHNNITDFSLNDDPTNHPEILSARPSTTIAYTKRIQCTWEPSKKTDAVSRYFAKFSTAGLLKSTIRNNEGPKEMIDSHLYHPIDSEGEDAVELDSLVMALVKTEVSRETNLACVVTIVTQFWTLTSASCIEAAQAMSDIEEFVLIADYNGLTARGKTHKVSEIKIHPKYNSVNKSFDVAALKSDSRLRPDSEPGVVLASTLDFLMLTLGERLTILGYGSFRSDVAEWGLRAVSVYLLRARECQAARAARHLWPRGGVREAGCARGRLCAGVLYARGVPCHHCAGAPLLSGRLLLGVLTSHADCGRHCEPRLYADVSAPLVRDWLLYVTSTSVV